MRQEYKEAIQVLQEIIRIEPAARQAYQTLVAIHTELGNVEKALQLDILAAHLPPKSPEVWKDLGARSRDRGLLQQAIYCYTQAFRADKNDIEAVWDRAILYTESGKNRQAIAAFTSILKLHPHDINILRLLVPILITTEEIREATRLMQEAFKHYTQEYPSGPTEDSLQLNDVVDLVELFKNMKNYRDVIHIAKLGQRWLQGRKDSGYAWDSFRDDREYDEERKSRLHWEQNEQLRWMEDAPIFNLDIRLRISLGIARLMLGDFAEANVSIFCMSPAKTMLRQPFEQKHLDYVRVEIDVAERPEVYGEVAEAYFDTKHFDLALEFFSALGECDAVSGLSGTFRLESN